MEEYLVLLSWFCPDCPYSRWYHRFWFCPPLWGTPLLKSNSGHWPSPESWRPRREDRKIVTWLLLLFVHALALQPTQHPPMQCHLLLWFRTWRWSPLVRWWLGICEDTVIHLGSSAFQHVPTAVWCIPKDRTHLSQFTMVHVFLIYS